LLKDKELKHRPSWSSNEMNCSKRWKKLECLFKHCKRA